MGQSQGRGESEETRSANGIRFSFPADAFSALATTVDAERQCCRFLRFEIIVEPDNGPIRLSLSGPPGAREFVTALIDS